MVTDVNTGDDNARVGRKAVEHEPWIWLHGLRCGFLAVVEDIVRAPISGRASGAGISHACPSPGSEFDDKMSRDGIPSPS